MNAKGLTDKGLTDKGSTAKRLNTFERNNYFYGKLMTVRDFDLEQSYFIEKRKLLNRYLHGRGAVCGLEIVPHECPGMVVLKPGIALDCYGNEIVVTRDVEINLASKDENIPEEGKTVYVCIKYLECDVEPVPVLVSECSCDDTASKSSIKRETFEYEILQTEPEKPDMMKIPDLPCKKIMEQLIKESLGPCATCGDDGCVVLAEVRFTADAPVPASDIDNISYRRIVLSNEKLLSMIIDLYCRQNKLDIIRKGGGADE